MSSNHDRFRKAALFAAVSLFGLMIYVAAVVLPGMYDQRRQREAAVLREQAPAVARAVKRDLKAARMAFTQRALAAGDWSLAEATEALAPFTSLPEAMTYHFEVMTHHLRREQVQVVALQQARSHETAAAELIGKARAASRDRDFLVLGSVLDEIDAQHKWINPPCSRYTTADLQREEVSALRKRFGTQIAAARAAKARADANQAEKAKALAEEAQALRERCGDKPDVSGWDGGVSCAKDYLKETAGDPDAIEVTSCTEPVLTRNECWVTTCRVRGKNAFGGRVLRLMRFSIGAPAPGWIEGPQRVLVAKYVD